MLNVTFFNIDCDPKVCDLSEGDPELRRLARQFKLLKTLCTTLVDIYRLQWKAWSVRSYISSMKLNAIILNLSRSRTRFWPP